MLPLGDYQHVAPGLSGLTTTDFNQDGQPDLITTSWGDNVVSILVNATELERFIRGDANGDGAFDVSDGVALLESLFVTGEPLPCAEGADANDDGINDLGDAIYIFAAQFLGGAMPPAPFPECGVDPNLFPQLGCNEASACP